MHRSSSRWTSARAGAGGLALAIPLLIGWGFTSREGRDLLPDTGLGYGLGIAGLAMMTALLGYSLRKHLPLARHWGPIRWWFRVHMVLGLLGPTAVLFHCDFELGSLNSAVALACVLVVSGSGVIGRFLYLRVQRGPQLQALRALRGGARSWQASETSAARCEPLARLLDDFERESTRPRPELLGEPRRFASLPRARRRARRAARALLRSAVPPEGRAIAAREVEAGLLATVRAARFGFYAWLLSLWHALHLPLCFLLFASAAIHVWAVHAY